MDISVEKSTQIFLDCYNFSIYSISEKGNSIIRYKSGKYVFTNSCNSNSSRARQCRVRNSHASPVISFRTIYVFHDIFKFHINSLYHHLFCNLVNHNNDVVQTTTTNKCVISKFVDYERVHSKL